MSKSNRIPDDVFTNILMNQESFLNAENVLGIEESMVITRCKDLYSRIVSKNREDIEILAKLEETINQLRCKQIAENNFKLSQVRGYIYARAPFYRMGKEINDIRVVVGKTSEYGENLDVLFDNEEFVIQAKKKLILAINEQLKDNIIFLTKLEEKYVDQCKTN